MFRDAADHDERATKRRRVTEEGMEVDEERGAIRMRVHIVDLGECDSEQNVGQRGRAEWKTRN